MRHVLIICLFLLFGNCSINKDSKYWTDDAVKRKEVEKNYSKILKKSEDITTMTVEEYYIYIDGYTKKSKYPDISK